MKTRLAIATLVAALATGAIPAELSAKPTPAPPAPTSGFCINKTTGAMRVRLVKNGAVQACHSTEISLTLTTLQETQAPAPVTQASDSPTPDPTATASVAPAPSPAPSAAPTVGTTGGTPLVVDSTGKTVGALLVTGGATQLVLLAVNDTQIAVAVGQSGFLDPTTTGNVSDILTVYYPTSDCSRQGYLLANDYLIDNNTGKPVNSLPLVQNGGSDGADGAFVYAGTVYYAGNPTQLLTFASVADFTNPTNLDPSSTTEGCEAVAPGGGTVTYMAGPIATFDLSTLDVTPPFSVNQ